MPIVHYTQAVRGRLAFARTEQERRRLVSALARIAGARLLAFGHADEHLHNVLAHDQPGYLVRDMRRVLRRLRPDLQLKAPNVEVMDTRAYLRSTLDYVLRQAAHHRLAGVHPASWTGSCFQDLLGLRLLPGFDPQGIRRELQRLQLRELYAVVDLPVEPIPLATDEALRRAGAARLADLVLAVHAVGPELSGRDARIVQARRAAARLAVRFGVRLCDLAPYVGVTSVRALRDLTIRGVVDPLVERAVRGRLTLEDRIGGRALGA